MKCISLWQPWAWLLVHGYEHPNGKRVENRSWALPKWMSGKWCLIHASKMESREEKELADTTCQRAGLPSLSSDIYYEGFPLPDIRYGGIVGVVKWSGSDPRSVSNARWTVLGLHHWLIDTALPLPFIPWHGRQGFFDVPLSRLPGPYHRVGCPVRNGENNRFGECRCEEWWASAEMGEVMTTWRGRGPHNVRIRFEDGTGAVCPLRCLRKERDDDDV